MSIGVEWYMFHPHPFYNKSWVYNKMSYLTGQVCLYSGWLIQVPKINAW